MLMLSLSMGKQLEIRSTKQTIQTDLITPNEIVSKKCKCFKFAYTYSSCTGTPTPPLEATGRSIKIIKSGETTYTIKFLLDLFCINPASKYTYVVISIWKYLGPLVRSSSILYLEVSGSTGQHSGHSSNILSPQRPAPSSNQTSFVYILISRFLFRSSCYQIFSKF